MAKHLQITSSDILELLDSQGWDVGRHAMQPISEEMYLDILSKFDKGLLASYITDRSRIEQAAAMGIDELSEGSASQIEAEFAEMLAGYLPLEKVFAPRVPRVRPVIQLKKIKQQPDSTVENELGPSARKKREKTRVKILIRSSDAFKEHTRIEESVEDYGPEESPVFELPLNLELDNIDLELITRIVNMPDTQKLDLIEELAGVQ